MIIIIIIISSVAVVGVPLNIIVEDENTYYSQTEGVPIYFSYIFSPGIGNY